MSTSGICTHNSLIPTGFNLELQPRSTQAPHTNTYTHSTPLVRGQLPALPVCASAVIAAPNTLLDNAEESRRGLLPAQFLLWLQLHATEPRWSSYVESWGRPCMSLGYLIRLHPPQMLHWFRRAASPGGSAVIFLLFHLIIWHFYARQHLCCFFLQHWINFMKTIRL